MVLSKKRILILIDWYLPGTNSGGPVRSCSNLIDHLGEEYDFSVITRNTDYCQSDSYENIESDAWNKVGANTDVFYISKKNINFRFIKKLLNKTRFDLIYINGIYSFYFSFLPVFYLRNAKIPILVAARGMLNPQAFSVKPVKKRFFLFLIKIGGFYKNVCFHATNDDEKHFIEKFIDKFLDIKVAPNLPRKKVLNDLCSKPSLEVVRLASVARISQEKGTLKTLEALSQLNSNKEIQYDIYGPIYDQTYWEKCQEIIESLPENIRVSYKGSIKGNIVPTVLNHYHFFVMPSEGENYGHGIVEAFTSGCPVIISNKTPWKDLESKQVGWDVSLADHNKLKSALSDAIGMNEDSFHKWSLNSRSFAETIINDEETLNANRKLFSWK